MHDAILNAIDEQIANLVQARTILAGSSKSAGKPGGSAFAAAASKPAAHRRLSDKARHAIAEAQRRRWNLVKNQEKAAETTPAKESAAS